MISINRHNKFIQEALLGDYIGFKVKIPFESLKRGYVVSASNNDSHKAAFIADIIIINNPGEIN